MQGSELHAVHLCINNTPINLTWSAGSWRWSGFLQSRWSSLEFAECPALWAGSLQHRSCLNCLSSWRKNERKSVRIHSFPQNLSNCHSHKVEKVFFRDTSNISTNKIQQFFHKRLIHDAFKRLWGEFTKQCCILVQKRVFYSLVSHKIV